MNFSSKKNNNIKEANPFNIHKRNNYQNLNKKNNNSHDIKINDEYENQENYYEKKNYENQTYEDLNLRNNLINDKYYNNYSFNHDNFYNDSKASIKQSISEKKKSNNILHLKYENNKNNINSKKVSHISKKLFSDFDNYYNNYYLDEKYSSNDIENIYYIKNNNIYNYNNIAFVINKNRINNYNNINSYYINDSTYYNTIDNINKNYMYNKDIKKESQNSINNFYQNIDYKDDSWLKSNFSNNSTILKKYSKEKNLRKNRRVNHLRERNQLSQKLRKNFNIFTKKDGNNPINIKYNNFLFEINKENKNKNKNSKINTLDKNNNKENIISNRGNSFINRSQYDSKRVILSNSTLHRNAQDFINISEIENIKNRLFTKSRNEKSNFKNNSKRFNVNIVSKNNIQNKKNYDNQRTISNYSKNDKIENIPSKYKRKYKISNDTKLKLKNHNINNRINDLNKSKIIINDFDRREMFKKNLLAKSAKKECDKCHKKVDSHLFKIHSNSHPSEIFKWLYLGTFVNACDINELRRIKVNYILNCASECKNKNLPKDIKELHLKVKDDENFKIIDYFEEANEFIHKCKLEGGILLVHCKYGISRSASFVIAYLIKYMRYNVDYSFNFVYEKRSQIKPNKGFMNQLYIYEENYLRKKKNN